ncbi:MAG: MauE/DoxX family redox-associated membrane protein [Solirubrobacteraceae bacterium]
MTPISLGGTGAVTGLGFVLALAGVSKLGRPGASQRLLAGLWFPASGRIVRAVSVGELVMAALALVLPTRLGGLVLAAVFAGFAGAHLHLRRSGRQGCGCFGESDHADRLRGVQITLTGGSALVAVAVAVATPPAPVSLARSEPGVGLLVVVGAWLVAVAWRRAFTAAARAPAPVTAAERLVTSSALFLERRFSRRTLLLRIALAGSALSVAPLRYLLYPVSALAAISPGSCGGGLCTDGYTAFCCEINEGQNSCPAGTFPGGWWMCTSYQGSQLCSAQGVRYYVDCNRLPGQYWPGGCACANGNCANRRVACNVFRYGQCNPQIGGVTEVVCRMVVCENPGSIPGLNCSSSVAVDDAVCGHDVPCLEPPAVELAGAGGV